MDVFLSDVRYAFRLFRKSPVFTSVAVTTLALGIGANTAIFSVVDAVVIRPLPYPDPDRVVMVWEDVTYAGFPKNTPAPANFVDWRRLNRSFVDMAATRGTSASVTRDAAPEQILGRAVTPSFFSVLGVSPAAGRAFDETEDRDGASVVVISHGLWLRRYGGDAAVIGRKILLNDTPYTVVGVVPREFVFRNREIDYWIPIHFSPADAAERGSHYLQVVARLKPGVSVEAARSDMASVARALSAQFPDNRSVRAVVVEPIKEDVLGRTGTELLVLMAAAASILLIACANLAGLILSRAAGRRGELAIRAALGASSGRIVRQLTLEGLVLSIAGGTLGLVLAPAAIQSIGGLVPLGVYSLSATTIDRRLLVFTAVVSVAAALAFSVIPAIQASRRSVQEALQQQSRSTAGSRSKQVRDALIVFQVAATFVLLVATGLMLRTLANLHGTDIGFRPDHILTLKTTPPFPRYADPVKRTDFYNRVLAGVRVLPGVSDAAYGSVLPFASQGNTRGYRIEGRRLDPDDPGDALFRVGTARYLHTLGVRMIEGRLFDDTDGTDSAPVVIINETMARHYWPGESALGHRVAFLSPNQPMRAIVGVVADVRERGYEIGMKPAIYVPTAQISTTLEMLIARTTGDPRLLAGPIQQVVASVDPGQPVAAVRPMEDIIDATVSDRRQHMTLLATFAALALVLVSLGLYGLLAYAVSQRSREIGLRMALGATSPSVVRMIIRRGLGATALGLVIGLAAAWGITRTMQSLVYAVATSDRATLAAASALLGTIALVACAVPAFRASRVDPIVVLREE